MRAFLYERPDRLADALALLAGDDDGAARPLAGGTDLIIRIRDGSIRPATVVDVKGIEELASDIRIEGGWLRIGARTTMTDLMRDERIRRDYTALAEAAAYVGSVQIRNRATLAGNICNASPAADTAPALLVFGARVIAVGQGGRRVIPLDDFFVRSGVTTLARGELVEAIEMPPSDRRTAGPSMSAGPAGAATTSHRSRWPCAIDDRRAPRGSRTAASGRGPSWPSMTPARWRTRLQRTTPCANASTSCSSPRRRPRRRCARAPSTGSRCFGSWRSEPSGTPRDGSPIGVRDGGPASS